MTPTPNEDRALSRLRRLVDAERDGARTKQWVAGAAADKQMPFVDGHPEVVRPLLVQFNLYYLGSRNRAKGATGRVHEEVRTADGTLEKHWSQLSLWEADAVIARKRELAGGIALEADYLQELHDIAEDRARERGLDPDAVIIVIGDYIDPDEAAEIRRGLAGA